MSTASAPVVVMRWFHDGAGYAFDERIDSSSLRAIIDALGEVFAGPPGSSFRLTLSDGRLLLGDKQLDLTCLDEKATSRQPTIVRAVVLDRPAGPRLQERLLRQLAALPLPGTPGPQTTSLSLPLPPPIHVPTPAVTLSTSLLRLAPWLVAGLLLAIEASLYAATGSADPPRTFLLRAAGIVLVAVLLALLIPRVASRKELDDLETAWAGGKEEDEHPPLAGLADEAIVLLDGRPVVGEKRAPSAGWLQGGGMPTAVADPEYTAVACYPGMAVLRGFERVQVPGGDPVRCSFVRSYAWLGRKWRIVFVQWTPVADARLTPWPEQPVPAAASPPVCKSASLSADHRPGTVQGLPSTGRSQMS